VSGSIRSGLPTFYASIPAGYAATPGKAGTAAGAAADIVDIRVPLPAGGFTARAGDSLSVRELFGSPTGDLMRVALRGEGGGRLVLRGADVTGTTDFAPMDFNELQFVAGADGSAQDLVAVVRTGTRAADGGWVGAKDSAPVQITARVTGERGLGTAAALRTQPGAGEGDAAFLRLAQEAAIFAASGSRVAPTLSSTGDVALKAGDTLALHDLFTAGGKAATALYRVALRDDGARPGARLLLAGEDVTGRTDFTPEEFVNLQFRAGPAGGVPEILVVARAGTRGADGSWTGLVDSPAVAVTAAATGTRSANVAPALRGAVDPADPDAGFLRVAQEAAIFAGTTARPAPALSPVGDIGVKLGDSLSLRDLFPATGKVEPALYRVALRDDPAGPAGGRLLLNGEDVTHRTDFAPLEFLALQYVAGPAGGAQDLLVVARTGKEDGKGGLTNPADSPPALIRAAVTGLRTLNAAEALRTAIDPAAADADFMTVASDAALHAPLGAQVAPALVTAGNLTAAAGDRFALRDLVTSPYDAKVELSGYRVALRDEDRDSGAALLLDGTDVSRRIDFTPAEFDALRFVAGRTGSATDLLVVARRRDAAGLAVDSRAVQITAAVTGERSVNGLPALRDAAPDDAFARLVQEAAVHAPFGGRVAPALRAAGDFTAAGGDLFSMNALFDTAGGTYDAGMSYHLALRDDPSGTSGGALLLNGADVTGRTAFTGAEFAALLFRAGPAGSAQDLLVVARRTEAATGLSTDSPATEITARATGTRSINALAALRTAEAAPSGFDAVVRDAAVFASASGPKLSTVLSPAAPRLSAPALAGAVGAYRASGSTASAANTLDLTALLAGLPGADPQRPALARLVTLLGGDGTVGGVRTAGTELSRLTALALNAKA